MPAFSFKERFVPMVKDGSKPGTIRAYRKYPIKVGQLAHLYYGMRTKFCTKLIDPSPVIREVKTIYIDRKGSLFLFDNPRIEPSLIFDKSPCGVKSPDEVLGVWRELHSMKELDEFAWKDGFRFADEPDRRMGCYGVMLRYWKFNGGVPFIGNHILWGK